METQQKLPLCKKQLWGGPWHPDAVKAIAAVNKWFEETKEYRTWKELRVQIVATVGYPISDNNFQKNVLKACGRDPKEVKERIVYRSKIKPPRRRGPAATPALGENSIQRFVSQLADIEAQLIARIDDLENRLEALETPSVQ